MLQKNERKYIQDIISKKMSRDVVCGSVPGLPRFVHVCVGRWDTLQVEGGDGCTAGAFPVPLNCILDSV